MSSTVLLFLAFLILLGFTAHLGGMMIVLALLLCLVLLIFGFTPHRHD